MDQLNWNTVANMINMYRTNNTAKLNPDQIACINLVRDIFIKADPLPVNVAKRFANDQELIEYYANLEKKYSGLIKLNGAHGIFDKSFVISPIMKAYAEKFYKRRLNLAASHLSDVFKQQMANAVTQSKPLPLLNSDTSNEYLLMLYQKVDIAPNVQQSIELKNNERLNMCFEILNGVVEDVLFGAHNSYYINTCLCPKLKTAVHRFRNNITYLLNSPLNVSTNIFGLIEKKAVQNGQPTNIDYSQMEIVPKSNIPLKHHLSELAFENEALRRAKIQELNIKYTDLP
ncbi:GP41 [Pieris rapae granulovirus Wuhan]|uniref:GP41 n=1 Tax=Pieris rapae granulovirus Wuhan TaxID=2848030 RepID=D2J4Q5_9BBAC|nr:GP41 [Betabaculovirus arrapae]ACZ63574.1 GP41 [Betabaculovirus arrapae]ADO85517.1 gp41 [Pieris rapae granulovirus]AGS18846.1 structural glycoprotein p40/gp41 [Pieris rapae granulovirus]